MSFFGPSQKQLEDYSRVSAEWSRLIDWIHSLPPEKRSKVEFIERIYVSPWLAFDAAWKRGETDAGALLGQHEAVESASKNAQPFGYSGGQPLPAGPAIDETSDARHAAQSFDNEARAVEVKAREVVKAADETIEHAADAVKKAATPEPGKVLALLAVLGTGLYVAKKVFLP